MTTVVLNTVTRKVEVFSSARDVQARAEIADHRAAADPHPQYLANANAADIALSGDAGDLIAGTVPDSRMPSWTGYNLASRAALEAANVPAAIDGLKLLGHATVGDGGGAYYKRVASEPAHPHKIKSADGAWWEELFAADVTIRIPSDFATLQEAIDRLSKQPVRRGARIIINIEAGHALTAGLTVENGDYSRFTITSTDAEVTLAAGWTAGDHVAKGINARMPTWGILLDCGNKDVGASGALNVETNSDLHILDGCGVKNAGVVASDTGGGLFVYRNSRVVGSLTVFTGSAGVNVWVTHHSRAYLERGNFSSSASTTGNVYVSRVSELYAAGADFSNSTSVGLMLRRSKAVVIPYGVSTATTFDNNGTFAIDAANSSIVIAHARNVPVAFSNCVSHGINSREGSLINIQGATFTTVTNDAIRAESGGVVIATNVTLVSGIGGNGVRCNGARVYADSITANVVGKYALYALRGGEIIAANATCTGTLGAAAVRAETGSRVSCYAIDVSNATATGLYASGGSEINAAASTGTSCGTYGVNALEGCSVHAPNSDYSGAGANGALVTGGTRLTATDTNLQKGGSAAGSDLVIANGSIVAFEGGTGGTNTTVNALTAAGIIFQ